MLSRSLKIILLKVLLEECSLKVEIMIGQFHISIIGMVKRCIKFKSAKITNQLEKNLINFEKNYQRNKETNLTSSASTDPILNRLYVLHSPRLFRTGRISLILMMQALTAFQSPI